MAKSNNQKLKILFLEKMLQETREDAPISMQEILTGLSGKGISAERKSIYDDMEALRQIGLDVKYRRGKPGGYYLEGQTQENEDAKKSVSVNESEDVFSEAKTLAVAEEAVETEAKAAHNTAGENCEVSAWITELSHAGAKREMKLYCEEAVREAVHAYLGTDAHFKEKEKGFFTVTAQVVENPLFYGWLTAMGKSVHIQKPKKSAQAYREYLKTLAREYKGF